MERASVLYHGILAMPLTNRQKAGRKPFNSFWDYFLLDYRLMLRDMHPLEYFYETVCSSDSRYYDAGFAKRNSDYFKGNYFCAPGAVYRGRFWRRRHVFMPRFSYKRNVSA